MFQQPVPLFGDPVADIVVYLRSHMAFAVGQSMRGWSGGGFVRLTRSGGSLDAPLERVDVQFDCYGDDADEALDAANDARLLAAVAPDSLEGCVQAIELVGPVWLPDGAKLEQPRYVCDWAFLFRV